MTVHPDGTATLVIDGCTPDDEGIYRAVITGPLGTAQSKGTATVQKL